MNLLESSDTAGIQELKSCSPEFTLTIKTTSSDIGGIQDSQSYSPGYTITAKATKSVITGKLDSQSYLPVRNIASESQKHKIMTMDEFLDSHPLPTNFMRLNVRPLERIFIFWEHSTQWP